MENKRPACLQDKKNLFWKVIYTCYSKLSKEIKKKHQNLGRLNGYWIIDPNIILTVLIHNLKTSWPTKIPMSFLSSLNNLQ